MSEITQLLLNQRESHGIINYIPHGIINYIPGYLPPGFFERYHFLNPGKGSTTRVRNNSSRPLGWPELTLAVMTLAAYDVTTHQQVGYASGVESRTKPDSLEDTVNVMSLVNPNNSGFGWQEYVALNPDVVIGDRTESTKPKVKPRDAPASGASVYKKSVSHPADSSTTRYGRNLKDNLRKLIESNGNPTELYNHTYREGKRNESTYGDFFSSWMNAQIGDIFRQKSYNAFLKDNPHLNKPLEILYEIEDDGRISKIFLSTPDDLIDNYGIKDSLVQRLIFMCKDFVPPPQKKLVDNDRAVVTEITSGFTYALNNPFSTSKSSESPIFKTIFPKP